MLIDENRENLTKIVVEEKQIVQVKQVEIGETLNQEDSLLINKSRENLTKVDLGAKQQINEEKLLVKNERTDGREI